MVQFNKLSITPDNQKLIIDVSVIDSSYYENVYLESIKIDNQDTFVSTGVSSAPVYSYTVDPNTKRVYLEITPPDLVLADNLLFVYVTVTGIPSPDTPCGQDNKTTIGVVTNLAPIYAIFMSFVKELASNCKVPTGFIDFFMKYNALKYAILSGNYTKAIMWWNKFFKAKHYINITSDCNCGNG